MANVIVLKDKNGNSLYPVTDVSLVAGLQEGAIMETVVVESLPTASSSTVGKIYLIESETEGEYDRYLTTYANSAYTWTQLGSTTIPSPTIADNLTTNDATKALSAKQGKVLNESLTELGQKVDEKVDVLPGDNLVNPELFISGKGISVAAADGSLGTVSTCRVSGYIPIKGNNIICNGLFSSYWCGAVYDENYNFLRLQQNAQYTYQSGDAYLRLTFGSSTIGTDMANYGTTLLPYKQFSPLAGYLTTDVLIPDNSVTTPKIADNSVTTPKIADGAVTPEKASFFVLSKNLFDYTTMLVAEKYITIFGNEGSNANYYCSSFIPISKESGNDIVSTMYGSEGAANAFYDENKEFISYFQTKTVEIPQNAKYVRWSFRTTDTAVLKTIQVEYGTTSTSFVPYGDKIDEKYIPQPEDAVSNEIIVPKYLYLLSGVNNNVFYEPILRKWNPYRYDVFANTTPNERDYVKAIKRVVTLNNPTATGLSLSLYDLEKEDFIQTKAITLRKGTQGVGSEQIKVGIIGDSYTDGGCFTPALLDNGYVPNLKMVGTRSVNTSDQINQKTDGRSGWSLSTFFSVRTGADEFNPFYHPQGIHRYWGDTAFWKNVCGGSPSGYGTRYIHYASLCDANGWPVSPSEGDVIYDSTNTAFKEYQSGSWVTVQQTDYTWEFNYAKYLTMWNVDTPDVLAVMLGVNDFWVNHYPTAENLATWKERMNTIKTAFLTSNPSGKFVILTANTVTHKNVNHYRPLDVHNRMQTLREFVIKEWDEKDSEGVYVVDTAQLIDSENAFTLVEVAPFDGYPNGYSYANKEVYAGDGQHPRVAYTTLGYSLAAFIQYIRE